MDDLIYTTLDLQFVIFAKSEIQFNNVEQMLNERNLKYIKLLTHPVHQTVNPSIYGVFIMDQTKNNIKVSGSNNQGLAKERD